MWIRIDTTKIPQTKKWLLFNFRQTARKDLIETVWVRGTQQQVVDAHCTVHTGEVVYPLFARRFFDFRIILQQIFTIQQHFSLNKSSFCRTKSYLSFFLSISICSNSFSILSHLTIFPKISRQWKKITISCFSETLIYSHLRITWWRHFIRIRDPFVCDRIVSWIIRIRESVHNVWYYNTFGFCWNAGKFSRNNFSSTKDVCNTDPEDWRIEANTGHYRVPGRLFRAIFAD